MKERAVYPLATKPPHLGEDVIVSVRGLHKFFGETHILRGIDLDVWQGEAVMVIGRSGSGKTTLLRCINFLEEPTLGTIEVDGLRVAADPLQRRRRGHREEIRQIRLRAGMLFQGFNLFPHMSVLQNCIEAPVNVKRMRRDEAIAMAEKYLDKVGLLYKKDEYPARLSGGQKQRVVIARALYHDPDLIAFDEATSTLDVETEKALTDHVLQFKSSKSMIAIAHRLGTIQHCDRVIFLENGTLTGFAPFDELKERSGNFRKLAYLSNL